MDARRQERPEKMDVEQTGSNGEVLRIEELEQENTNLLEQNKELQEQNRGLQVCTCGCLKSVCRAN